MSRITRILRYIQCVTLVLYAGIIMCNASTALTQGKKDPLDGRGHAPHSWSELYGEEKNLSLKRIEPTPLCLTDKREAHSRTVSCNIRADMLPDDRQAVRHTALTASGAKLSHIRIQLILLLLLLLLLWRFDRPWPAPQGLSILCRPLVPAFQHSCPLHLTISLWAFQLLLSLLCTVSSLSWSPFPPSSSSHDPTTGIFSI